MFDPLLLLASLGSGQCWTQTDPPQPFLRFAPQKQCRSRLSSQEDTGHASALGHRAFPS